MDTSTELRIVEDIKQLKARYFRFTDGKDWVALREVFCDDAVLGDDAGECRGGDAIVDLIRRCTEGVTTVHHGHCHEVWVDSIEAARGVIAFEDRGYDQASRELVMHGFGHYHETYRRERGAWRILASRIPRMAVVDLHPLG